MLDCWVSEVWWVFVVFWNEFLDFVIIECDLFKGYGKVCWWVLLMICWIGGWFGMLVGWWVGFGRCWVFVNLYVMVDV